MENDYYICIEGVEYEFEDGLLSVTSATSSYECNILDLNNTKSMYECMRGYYEPNRQEVISNLTERLKDILYQDDKVLGKLKETESYKKAKKYLMKLGKGQEL